MENNLSACTNIIINCENIFFVKMAIPVNFKNIDVESAQYNPAYENRVRKPGINFYTLLDEILQDLKLVKSNCTDSYWELEKIFLSADFYRKLILKNDFRYFKNQLKVFCKNLDSHIDVFKANVSEEVYQEGITGFDFLMPLKNLNSFIEILEELSFSLNSMANSESKAWGRTIFSVEKAENKNLTQSCPLWEQSDNQRHAQI